MLPTFPHLKKIYAKTINKTAAPDENIIRLANGFSSLILDDTNIGTGKQTKLVRLLLLI